MGITVQGGEEGPETLSHRLDRLVTHELHARNIPGAVLVVDQGGLILHRGAYGFAELYSDGGKTLPTPERMTEDHVFDLASLTKVFATTFGLMLLVDRGELDLDKPISHYLSVFEYSDKKSIPIYRLLNHTAGLVEWQPLYLITAEPGELIRYLAALPLKYNVGRGRNYSDLGFMILGACIEKIAGQSFGDFLEREVYLPLGLSHTGFRPDPDRFPRVAATSCGNPQEYKMAETMYRDGGLGRGPESFSGWRDYVLKGEVNDGNAFHVFGGAAGHAGLFSNAADLLRLVSQFTDSGQNRGGGGLLKGGTIRDFLDDSRYGSPLGWAASPESILVDEPPPGTIGHTGFTGTSVVVLPEQDITILLLTNRQHGGLGGDSSYPDVNPLRRLVADTVISTLVNRSGQ